MKIINKTKGTVIAQEAIFAQGHISRIVGLLNRDSLPQGEALIIKPCSSIHTFFMRFPIDVIFVDRDNKVIKTISCIKPFRLTGIYFLSKFVVELPAGIISSSNTQKADLISLI
jgi:uncharacterized protein